MSFLSTWQFYLIGYFVCSVFFNQLYKLVVNNCKKDGAVTIIIQSVAGISALLLMPFFPFIFPTDWRVYLFLGIACIFYAINDRIQTTVRKNMQVSSFVVAGQLSSVFLIIFGLTIFREPFSWFKIFGAILILGANIILRSSKAKIKLDKYFWLATLARLSYAIAISIDVGISKGFNLPFYIMLTLIIPTLIIKTIEKIQIKEIVREFNQGNKKYILLTGFIWSLLILFVIKAYQLASFTLITPLAATSILMNVLVASIFFSEKGNIVKKIISSLLVVTGVFLTIIH